MAKKKGTTVGSTIITVLFLGYFGLRNTEINPLVVGGILIALAFLIIMFAFAFNSLSKKYIKIESAVRVVDIKYCLPFFGSVGGLFLFYSVIPVFFYNIEILWIRYLIYGLYILIFIIGGIIAMKHLAVLYFGVVVDKERDLVAFTHDMESYTVMDYISLQFVIDYCTIDTIQLSEINRLSRGRGVELYMHGSFGSRGIKFSSKQKRDEALAIVKEFNANNTKLLPDIEGY